MQITNIKNIFSNQYTDTLSLVDILINFSFENKNGHSSTVTKLIGAGYRTNSR